MERKETEERENLIIFFVEVGYPVLGHMPDIRYITNCFRRKLDLVVERKETEERREFDYFLSKSDIRC